MTFETAFRKIVNEGIEIEPVCNCDYLYECEGRLLSEEEVIEFAGNL